MSLSAGEIAGILQEMKNNGKKYSSTTDPEQKIAAHDANVAWGNYLAQHGYTSSYNTISGDWNIQGGSLYGVPTPAASQQPGSQATNGYYPQPNVPVQQTPEKSLLKADTPNIGGLVAIGTVLGLLFLLK